MQAKGEIAIVGYACRVPGARDSDGLWQLMRSNQCAVSWITPDPRAGDDLRMEIALVREHLTVFRASLTGRAATSAPSFLRGSLRHCCAGQRVMALIKLQGIRLWLRRLPVVPRPPAPAQEGVQA